MFNDIRFQGKIYLKLMDKFHINSATIYARRKSRNKEHAKILNISKITNFIYGTLI